MPSFFFFLEVRMRYHYEKPGFYTSQYGEVYICDHPVYNRCTLYKIREKGLAVIQQRFDPVTKTTCLGELDPWLTDAIYLHAGFYTYFEKRAKPVFRRPLPHYDRSPAHVGDQDEAACEGTLGDRVRSARYLSRNLQFLI